MDFDEFADQPQPIAEHGLVFVDADDADLNDDLIPVLEVPDDEPATWDLRATDPALDAVSTVDSDGDGIADTAVARTSDGTTVLITDIDGDGSPDAFTTVSTAGDVSSYALASDGVWAETGHGSLADEHPPATTDRPAVIDPVTGQWVRR